MGKYSVQYLGNLRNKITNMQNSEVIITDAPTDNCGEGKYFSPTDLIAVSLGSCVMTLIAINANLHVISIEGAYCNVEKIMQDKPRRIKSILMNVYLPDIDKAHRIRLEKAALGCPVYHALSTDVEKNIVFHWGSI